MVTVMRWYAQEGEPGGEWTEWGWRNEEGSWFHKWGNAYLKERLVICNEEDTDGRAVRARLTTYEERVLPVDWTEIRLHYLSGAADDVAGQQLTTSTTSKRQLRRNVTWRTVAHVTSRQLQYVLFDVCFVAWWLSQYFPFWSPVAHGAEAIFTD